MGNIAAKKTEVLPSGQKKETYIDVETGAVLTDTSKYYVYEYEDLKSIGLIKTTETQDGPKDVVDPNMLDKLTLHNSRMDTAEGQNNFKPNTDISNDFGYKQPPGVLQAASFAPGIAGMAAKAAQLGYNVNNMSARESARYALGLPYDQGIESVKGIVTDRGGKVADVMYKGSVIPVAPASAPALDPQGRTNMTVQEAQARRARDPSFREATKDESKAAIDKFQTDFGKPKGTVTSMIDSVTGGLASKVLDHIGYTKPQSTDLAPQPTATYDSTNSYSQFNTKGTNTPVSNNSSVPQGPMQSAPVDKGNRVVMANEGKVRDKPISPELNAVLNYAAYQTGVTVTVGSGGQKSTHNPNEKGKSGGWTGSHRHDEGNAADITLTKDGRPVDFTTKEGQAIFSQFAQYSAQAGATGLGASPSYMGTQTMHVGFGKEAVWGGKDGKVPDWLSTSFSEGRKAAKDFNINDWKPTVQSTDLAAPVGAKVDPVSNPSTNASASATARFATPQDRDMMAKTLAGEISTKTDLNSPEGKSEAFGILSTMENRAAGQKKSITDVTLAPNQYSTWNNPATTHNAITNYDSNAEGYKDIVGNFLTNPSAHSDVTSYYNQDIVNPDWSSALQGKQQIGDQTFGRLNDYGKPANVAPPSTPTVNTMGTGFEAKATADLSSSKAKGFADYSAYGIYSGTNGDTGKTLSSIANNSASKGFTSKSSVSSKSSTKASDYASYGIFSGAASKSTPSVASTNSVSSSKGTSSSSGKSSNSQSASKGFTSRSDGWT